MTMKVQSYCKKEPLHNAEFMMQLLEYHVNVDSLVSSNS